MTVPDGLTAEDFVCGTLVVPADWRDPDDRTLSIEAGVLAARSAAPRPAPLLFFGGGPGAQNLEGYLQRSNAALALINQDRDIVFFDQRGNGLSDPALSCTEFQTGYVDAFTVLADGSADGAAYVEARRLCHEAILARGIDPSHYNSYQVAHDAAALMEALGHEIYDVYGPSYGARRAQFMMHEYPDRVRAAVLDSPMTAGLPNFGGWAASYQSSLDQLFADCAASPTCSAGNPDLRQAMLDAVERLDQTPHRLTITGDDGADKEVIITGSRFANGISQALSDDLFIPAVPQAITLTAAGDMSLVEAFAPALLAPSGADEGLYSVTLCSDEDVAAHAEGLDSLAGLDQPLVRPIYEIANAYATSLCEIVEVDPSPVSANDPIDSDIPTLVMSGAYDPLTPPSFGEFAVSHLSKGQHVLVDFLAHGMVRDPHPCVQGIITAFLDAPEVDVDATCLADVSGPFD